MNLSEIENVIASLNEPKFRAKQIFDWLQVYGAMSYDEMTNLPKALRNILSEKYPVRSCEIELKQVSKIDSTVKYLFKLFDGNFVESVLMKYKYGYTLCVSSQVGCKMGCTFCASTKSGCVRSLMPSEILGQIHAAQRDMNIRVSHVVMMGMGEPLDNYDNTIRFLKLASDEKGLNLSMRNISLSTCGIVPRIYDLLEEKLQLTLSISLHAPNDTMRSAVMPVNKKYPVKELIKACKDYTNSTSRRISFEYAMIRDVNDSDECAYELASLLKGMLCHVNLIPANEINESEHKRSTNDRLQRFMNILNSKGVNTTIRRSLGSDIDASCGQLRSKHVREKKEKEGEQ
ncbi:MAG: 23S rRNA (adenine(2503)-C(2))-methyltransferase RlmN [Acutalibacteraceae bacterium]|nr:23S rRNA (adenine(2503)-C(2))-methyltransferase RlmN [Acutalibacteraceae bacterium]